MGAANSSFEAKELLARGKKETAAYIYANPSHLDEVLDNILNPNRALDEFDEWETIDWCKWLIAGGQTPDEFSSIVRTYDDDTLKCGEALTTIAYCCKTCSASPAFSLCTECFEKGNHQTHNFYKIQSKTPGTCDCGDTSVMKKTGFCDRHKSKEQEATSDIMHLAKIMIPRIILRLIQHLRDSSNSNSPEANKTAIEDADGFITMLLEFRDMGVLMRKIVTEALTNSKIYTAFTKTGNPESTEYMIESRRIYEDALKSLSDPFAMDEYNNCPALQEHLEHKTFLEELVFWIVKYEFPQKLTSFVLDMPLDQDYEDALTRAFVIHYRRISMMLERSADPDTLCHRVDEVTSKWFSNESLSLRMIEQLKLLHVVVVSLKCMVGKSMIPNTLHDQAKNSHYVVDCEQTIMKNYYYCPIQKNLLDLLNHRSVTLKFMGDAPLVEMWFTFLSMFQGMDVTHRRKKQQTEIKRDEHAVAYNSELEMCAYPMLELVSHLSDASTAHLTRRFLSACLNALIKWFNAINFTSPDVSDSLQVSFHLPLHRHFAVFLSNAVAKQNITVDEVLPSHIVPLLMMHPLRIQVACSEVVENWSHISSQIMDYEQIPCSTCMLDPDLYLLQICCTRMQPDTFFEIVIDKFHMKECMSVEPKTTNNTPIKDDPETFVLENFLTFLATLVSIRTNLGLSEIQVIRLEMITHLCIGDKTYSELMNEMPEGGAVIQKQIVDSILAEVADYKMPEACDGNVHEKVYFLKPQVWEKEFDPMYVLLRSVYQEDICSARERYVANVRKLKPGVRLWLPFRTPTECSMAYDDPRKILSSKVFHAAAFIILYKATKGLVMEYQVALTVFLLQQAVLMAEKDKEARKACKREPQPRNLVKNKDLSNWFTSDCLSNNLRTVIQNVALPPKPLRKSKSCRQNPGTPLNRLFTALSLNQDECQNSPPIIINKSIIWLLLRLHFLYLPPHAVPTDYYSLKESRASASNDGSEQLIGGASFYIGRLLNRIAALDNHCRQYILKLTNIK